MGKEPNLSLRHERGTRQCLDGRIATKGAFSPDPELDTQQLTSSTGSARRLARNTHGQCYWNSEKQKVNDTLKSKHVLMVLFCFQSVFPINPTPKGTLGLVSYLGPTKPSTARTLSKSLLRVNTSRQGILSGLLTHESRNISTPDT